MRNTLKYCLITAGVLFFGIAGWAGPSECDAVQDNLITNCGWESNCWFGWHPSASIVDIGRDEFAHSGDYRGIIHAHPGLEYVGEEDLPVVVGQAYTLSFWVRNTEPVDRLQVLWSSDRVDQIVLDLENIPPQDYTQIVIPDLIASSVDTGVFWGFANALGDIDIDDVVLVPIQE
jgi:hypothetical protein